MRKSTMNRQRTYKSEQERKEQQKRERYRDLKKNTRERSIRNKQEREQSKQKEKSPYNTDKVVEEGVDIYAEEFAFKFLFALL